ncbi:MAG TPA: hypothetical protein VGE47_14815, partial [Burkholderiaceae bacterium]
LGSFNTPKTAQVNALYLDLLGIKKLSAKWSWQGISSAKAEAKLDTFIDVRGDIAHRLNPGKAVHKHLGASSHEHVKSIVDSCEQAVRAHLIAATGENAW